MTGNKFLNYFIELSNVSSVTFGVSLEGALFIQFTTNI